MNQMITSAALYSEPQAGRSIPLSWLEETIRVLAGSGLPIREFSMSTSQGVSYGPYRFDKHRDLLFREVQQANVTVLGLYCDQLRSEGLLLDWQGLAYTDLTRGDFFLGLPQACEPSPGALIRLAYGLSRELCEVSYGIGFFHEHCKGPDLYAVGIIANPSPSIFSDPQALANADRISKWYDERNGQRRYLMGWFRSVYPANFLSETHINMPLCDGKTLRNADLGRLTFLGHGHWLWELSDQQIPVAEDVLKKSGLVIC